MNDYDGREMDYVFIMQDVAGYIKAFGVEQFLHDFKDLYPNKYQTLEDACVNAHNKRSKAVLLCDSKEV